MSDDIESVTKKCSCATVTTKKHSKNTGLLIILTLRVAQIIDTEIFHIHFVLHFVTYTRVTYLFYKYALQGFSCHLTHLSHYFMTPYCHFLLLAVHPFVASYDYFTLV